jgi:hypothetical protein
VDVFYNGSKLDDSEFTATNGTSIVLGTACAVNDKVEVIAFSYNVNGFTGIGGSGTTNNLPKFTAAGTIGDSAITDNGTTVTLVSRALSGTSALFSSSLEAGRLGGAVTVGDLFVDSANNSVYVGRQSSTSGDNSKFYVRNRLNTLTALSVDPGGNGAVDVVGTFSTTRGTNLATATGNVGIGTATPTGTYGKLSVAGGISILDDNNAKLEIGRYSSGAPNSYIKIGTNSGSLRITNAADSVDLVTFYNGGNVVIGGTTAQNNASSRGNLTINGTTSILNLSISDTNGGYLYHGGTDLLLVNAKNGAAKFYTNDAERLRITPEGYLDFYYNGTTNTGAIVVTANDMLIGGQTGKGLILCSNNLGQERLKINASGAITINTPGAGQTLTINGKNNNWTQEVIGSSTTGQSYGILITAGTNSSDSSFVVQNQAGNANYFKVRGDGYLQSQSTYNNTTASPNYLSISTSGFFERFVSSSARYKEEIKDWNENGLAIILALKPKTYKYKKDYYNKADVDFLGLIAEDVAEVNTYLADYENEDRTGLVENVKYANIVVPLIKAVQELKAEIEQLKQK